MDVRSPDIAIIGAGPAGLFAAEDLSGRGFRVEVFDRMSTPGRKFLMAGRGGLNLTHTEPLDDLLARYRPSEPRLIDAIRAFPPQALRKWSDGLGAETFTGSSGRVFPKAMKASPLLRAWRSRLDGRGVSVHLRHDWRGWDKDGRFVFSTPGGEAIVKPRATLLALGGASWPRLGADGSWAVWLRDRGIEVRPFRPANAGFHVNWSAYFADRFAGTPLKHVSLSFNGRTVTGDAMIAHYGIEGGAVYALSADLRDALEAGPVTLEIDLRPAVDSPTLARWLAAAPKGESLANRLRKRAGLSPVSSALLREGSSKLPPTPEGLADMIKACPLVLTRSAGLDRAISSAGGIAFGEITEDFMLEKMPGVFVAGEMLDWEAPTGGYLLQACFSTGLAAARGAAGWLSRG